jgi:glycosyltransferase involved in cell wall biosynthesis
MARFLFYDDKIINILLREELPSGGAAVQALGWIHGLAEKGQDVYVLTNPAPREALKEGCEHLQLLPLYDEQKGIRWLRWVYYRLPYIYRKIKEVKPDYLYQGTPGWSSFLLGLICQLLGIKYVVRISNDFLLDDRFYKNYGRVHGYFQKLGFKLSYYILCQNEYQFSKIRQEFPGKKAFKISNPIFLKRVEKTDPIQAKEYIAWLGLFQYQKNLKLLYEIAQLLPDEQFAVAGKELPNVDADTKAYLEKLKKLPNVTFIGFLHRDQVLPFLAKAKFLLNTSHYEGFSNTFLEAMSVGTPIITSQKVNPDAIISTYQLGIVYQDAADLQRQHQSLTPQAYKDLSANVLHYVQEHHHYTTLAGRLISLLNDN